MHLVPFFADRSISQIEHEDVVDLVGVLERKRLAPKTAIRNVIATLSALFTFARHLRSGGGRPRTRATGSENSPATPRTTEIRLPGCARRGRMRGSSSTPPAGMFQAHDRRAVPDRRDDRAPAR